MYDDLVPPPPPPPSSSLHQQLRPYLDPRKGILTVVSLDLSGPAWLRLWDGTKRKLVPEPASGEAVARMAVALHCLAQATEGRSKEGGGGG